jgi:steroid delta-isomerase-like uncharacterized protein
VIPDHQALIRSFIERINERRFDAAAGLLAEDCVHHATGLGNGDLVGREAWRRWMSSLSDAFPDRHIHIHELLVEGERAAVRLTWTGTHLGEYAGIAPAGRRVEVNGISVFALREGRIAEQWIEQDILSMHQQLGAAPGRSDNWPVVDRHVGDRP